MIGLSVRFYSPLEAEYLDSVLYHINYHPKLATINHRSKPKVGEYMGRKKEEVQRL